MSKYRGKTERRIDKKDGHSYTKEEFQNHYGEKKGERKFNKSEVSTEQGCFCGEDMNRDMIQCDVCSRWIHFKCAALTQSQAIALESYKCPECIVDESVKASSSSGRKVQNKSITTNVNTGQSVHSTAAGASGKRKIEEAVNHTGDHFDPILLDNEDKKKKRKASQDQQSIDVTGSDDEEGASEKKRQKDKQPMPIDVGSDEEEAKSEKKDKPVEIDFTGDDDDNVQPTVLKPMIQPQTNAIFGKMPETYPRDLNEEEFEKVAYMLDEDGDPDENVVNVILYRQEINIQRKNLICCVSVKPSRKMKKACSSKMYGWANDEIIDAYMTILNKYCEFEPYKTKNNCIFLDRSAISYMVSNPNFIRKKTQFVSDNRKTMVHNFIVIPINRENNHWALFVVDTRKQEYIYLDSLHNSAEDVDIYQSSGSGTHETVNLFEVVAQFLANTFQHETKQTMDFYSWTRIDKGKNKSCPKQIDFRNCGYFVCEFAKYVMMQWQITKTSPSASMMDALRTRIVYELGTDMLLLE